ncbi:MAG: heparinase II/III-family protein [Desulfarculales bacterium]|jgi:hypothetical protein|nr:heparinase II/III-family protein [Desulfarculales bacterium]
MAVLRQLLVKMGSDRTIRKVRTQLVGARALTRFLMDCGYPASPQALMKRLHDRLHSILPLATSPLELAVFGRLLDGPLLMERARNLPLHFPSAQDTELSGLWPWLTAGSALELARANCLTGEFVRSLTRWLGEMLSNLAPPAGLGWQDSRILASRAINLLFCLRFTDNPHKMSAGLCGDLLLHLYLTGQVMEQNLNGALSASSSVSYNYQTHLACALMFLGFSFDFLPEAGKWRDQGCAALGPAFQSCPQEAGSLEEMSAALRCACLGMWLGGRQEASLPGLREAVRVQAMELRAAAPPWTDQFFSVSPLPAGPLCFSSDPGQESSLAAVLLEDPQLRGPRRVTELLFWLYGPEVEDKLRQLAGGSAPGVVYMGGLAGLTRRLGRERVSLWLSCPPSSLPSLSAFAPQSSAAMLTHPLSLSIFRGGQPLLLPPSRLEKGPLSVYFNSRAATNSLLLDDKEPGPGQVVVDALEHDQRYMFMAARFNGYMNLPDPVMVRRRIFVDYGARLINITDQIQGVAQHVCLLYFHFPPHAVIQKYQKGGHVVSINKEKWWFKTESKAISELIRGQANPPLGWALQRDGSVSPSPSLTVRLTSVGSARFSTSLVLLDPE